MSAGRSGAPPVVVIPTVLGGALLAEALAAIGDAPVLVVDDSPPGAAIETHGAPTVRAGGQGFAGACNQGLAAAAAAGHRWAVLLNDDARPAPGCLAALAGARRPGVGALGPVLVDAEGAVESAGIRHAWWGRVRAQRRLPVDDQPVDALSGACLLVETHRRLDAGHPHGMEDVALCRELRAAGLAVLLVARARCVHLGGATLPRQSAQAAGAALAGHLRLEGPGWRQGVALGLSAAQALREGAGPDRWRALGQAWSQR